MNETNQRIIGLEEEYFSTFCIREDEGILTRYSDNQMVEMHSHNFTWVKEPLTEDELKDLIGKELERRKDKGFHFLKLRLDWVLEADSLMNYDKKSVTNIEYYRIEPDSVAAIKSREDIEVIKLSDLMVDEARELDELCEEGDSLEFTKKRFDRRLEIYLKDQGPDNYLALLEWDAVGACDFFAQKNTCMLEDFVVDPEYRNQGIGTALLKILAEKAFSEGNDLVFIRADARETAREMYQKLGFQKLMETTEITFKF